MTAVYTILGIGNGITCDIAYAKMDASTPDDRILQIRYPPTMETIVGSGPMQASVYCARPPVIFGMSAFNSDREPMVVRFKRHATTIAPINTTPTSPAPCPRETRQLVAITRPTEVETTLSSPNFFSSISSLLECV